MIYLVSSLHRSGSSMMMRCLNVGGLDAVWDSGQDNLNIAYGQGGYIPNPNGFYALDYAEFKRPDFVAEYDGKLVKCPWQMLHTLPVHAYRLVFMLREPKEIQASMQRFTPGRVWGEEIMTWLYAETVGAILRRLNARGDYAIRQMQYAQVVANPLVEFGKLKAADWPIDAAKAAAMVQPELKRFNLEAQ
jgi:hypothetical protein